MLVGIAWEPIDTEKVLAVREDLSRNVRCVHFICCRYTSNEFSGSKLILLI